MEYRLNDVIDMVQAVWRKGATYGEIAVVTATRTAACGEGSNPAFLFELKHQTAFTLVTQQVSKVGEGLHAIVRVHSRHWERENQFTELFDWLDLNQDARAFFSADRHIDRLAAQLVVWNVGEHGFYPRLLLIKRLRTKQSQRHQVSRILRVVKFNYLVADGFAIAIAKCI